LTGWVKSFSQAEKKALEIKKRIRDEVGDWLKASVGLSYTRWLAKFASDIAKKDSILIIKKNNLNKFLKRPLTDAWGINFPLKKRLNTLGIFNLLDLKNYPAANLIQALGKPGYYLWANVNGLPIEKVKKQREPKSVGHSFCLYKKSKDINYLSSVLLKLCEKTGRRLRLIKKEAYAIRFGLRFKNGGGLHKSKRLKKGLFTTKSIYKIASKIMEGVFFYEPVSFLAVSVFRLRPISRQMSLFDDNLKEKKISLAMDKINDQYGQYLVYWGNMHGTDKVARDRIGFRKTVNINQEGEKLLN